LAVPAALAALVVLWRGVRAGKSRLALAGMAAAMALAGLTVTIFGLDPILDRFAPQTAADARFEHWPYVWAAARDFFPVGSGVGSFERVFQAVEPLTLVGPTYFNHAHNEYLELWLETGLAGAGLLALFCLWLAPSAWRAWRGGDDCARAASLAIPLLMAASIVDYPLRTETGAVLFAFCCGLLGRSTSLRP
jgi:O-antigen ligase